MADNYAIVRLDRVSATRDASKLVSLKFYVGATATAIQNGSLVAVTDTLIDRDVFKATAPTATDTIKTVALVATPEVIYDTTITLGLENFVNLAGATARGVILETGDIISVTAPAISGTAVKGGYVALEAGKTTFKAVSVTDSAIGSVIDVETVDNDVYYVIKIK